MARSSLPAGALAYYISLGKERSFDAVAVHFSCSKSAVGRRAQKEGWGQVIQAIEAQDREAAKDEAITSVEKMRHRQRKRTEAMQDAVQSVATPERIRGLIATLLTSAIKDKNMAAARLLMDRVFGRVRSEPIAASALLLSGSLETAADVRRAASELLQGVAEGRLAPEDAQRAAAVVEAARRSVETEELERRLQVIEEGLNAERKGSLKHSL